MREYNTRVQARNIRVNDVVHYTSVSRSVDSTNIVTDPSEMIRVQFISGTVDYFLPRERIMITRYR